MRLLFSSIAAYGHVFPLLPLAMAARDAGHEVRFATAETFSATLAQAGLHATRASRPLNSSTTHVQGVRIAGPTISAEETLRRAGRIFGSDVPREFVSDLGPIFESFKPDLVIHDAFNPGAAIAARLAGIPALCHGLGRAPRGALAAATEHHLREYVAELGLRAPVHEALAMGNTVLDICPPSLQCADFLAAVNSIKLRAVPFAESGELPAAIESVGADRLIYVTLGTIYGNPAILREAVKGIVSLGSRVLVATGPTVDPAELGPQPPSVSIVRWVPQARLWPYVDLVVHHGGSGTMLGALAAGLPQIMIPRGADQYFNAVTLAGQGAALRVAPNAITATSIAERAERILATESFYDEARRLQGEIEQMPAPTDLARQLPDVLKAHNSIGMAGHS